MTPSRLTGQEGVVYAITYITHTWGGAYQYAEKARCQKKVVINLKKPLDSNVTS